ncbi:MAG: response regulator [Sphingobacteriaceae bacterium]|jgi:two-component system response regulator VicR|nr:response regulator [Sphingobacteriaceae bacterium]
MGLPKILVVEDEALMLKALEFRLKKDGYDVYTAKDGLEGMEQINSQRFDLIITDIMMPYIGGLELLSNVRNNRETRDTPVIILSVMGIEQIVLQGFELGADDFVTKPFNLSELSIRVRKYLKQVV